MILSCNVYGQAQFSSCGFISCVSGETKSLSTVTSRRPSVQAPGDVRVECWRFVIGRGKFLCHFSTTHPTLTYHSGTEPRPHW